MSRATFDQLRLPIGILLLLIVAFVFFPRDGQEPAVAGTTASPMPSVVVASVGGEVTEQSTAPTPPPTAVPTLTPAATPSPTPAPTPEPEEDDQGGFSAEVFACTAISGSECNGQLGTMTAEASSFVALVRFADANAGDEMNAVLDGPSGTIPGSPYTLQGGGDGYYYSQFQAGGLPAGDYTLTATRNGEPVATTSFTKADG